MGDIVVLLGVSNRTGFEETRQVLGARISALQDRVDEINQHTEQLRAGQRALQDNQRALQAGQQALQTGQARMLQILERMDSDSSAGTPTAGRPAQLGRR